MKRRDFIRGLGLLAACPLCAAAASASEGAKWSYTGKEGPEHWGGLNKQNFACSAGNQQSPINLKDMISAELPTITPIWQPGGGTVVNNGHTIQVNVPAGSKLVCGDKTYDLLQFHFHAPSEHKLMGRSFPMECHFVHKHAGTGSLGVLGVFIEQGASNLTFASLAARFPTAAGAEAPAPGVDPAGLLPGKLDYWAYEGSLTTPPCSEVVDWMVLKQPIEADAADIAKFTALYDMNARPVLPPNRRFILGSS